MAFRSRFRSLLALVVALAAAPAAAQTLTRGPLIENPDALPTTINIQWWTNVAGNSTVDYGLTPALGQSVTVAQAASCEIGSAGTCHSVGLTGLQPGTRYYYRLVTNGVEVMPTSSFVTMKLPSDPTPLVFGVIGDWGQGSSAYSDIAARIDAADPPLLFTVGDNAYQNGTQSDWDNNALSAYKNALKRMLFFPSLGNHDLNSVGAGNWQNSVEIKMFKHPRNAPAGQAERYYSFDHGDAHFVVLDSNAALDPTQRAWLQTDLANNTRRWTFAFFHHPHYSCASGLFSFGSYEEIRANWQPLFEQYGVDIVFTGHDHIYERSKYMDEYLLDGSPGSDGLGIWHVMTGGGGATLDGAASISSGLPRRSGQVCYWLDDDCPGGPSGTTFCSFARFSWTKITITNDEILTGEAIDRNGNVFDTFTIQKDSCGDGVLDLGAGEQCDQGADNGQPTSCCTVGCVLVAAGTTCRPSAGICDVAETCTGTSGACPANGFVPAGTTCRASAGACDLAETCTGSSATCPPDLKSTAPCRGLAGTCDVVETCDGVSNDCPADQVASSTTPCRPAAGVCDVAELCDGVSVHCPADLKSTALCRAAAGVCDVAESCDGVSDDCPVDTFLSSAVECRASAGICDVAETCTGVGPDCPPDGFQPPTVVCRAAVGVCDAAESCTGSSVTCPPDVKSTSVCRAAAGDCDLPEVCDGVSNDCPSDQKSTSVCRPVAGPCDTPESCDGVSDTCPADAFLPSSTQCRASAGICDVAEHCTGTSAACPPDGFQPSTTPCRAAAGECDVAETCSGSSAFCPIDQKSTAECRPAAGECDLAESCNGISNTCPPDVKSTSVCRPAAGACDLPESCDGTSDTCPADVLQSAGAVCRVVAGACDEPDACDGVSPACPADAVKPAGTSCRPSTGPCDVAESCDGTSGVCPPDQLEADGDGDGVCDLQDVCPTIADPTQADSDGDGIGDACDPCTNLGPRFVVQAKLTMQKLGGAAGDDRIKFTGSLTIPTSPAVDPITKGLRLILTDATGATVVDAIVPGGAYSAATRAGWTRNGTLTAFTYKNSGKFVPFPGGIGKVTLKKAPAVGQWRFGITGKAGTYPIAAGGLPVSATVIIDAPQATTGQCADAIFPGPRPAPSCTLVGTTLKCR
jgi:hypothetical protein